MQSNTPKNRFSEPRFSEILNLINKLQFCGSCIEVEIQINLNPLINPNFEFKKKLAKPHPGPNLIKNHTPQQFRNLDFVYQN